MVTMCQIPVARQDWIVRTGIREGQARISRPEPIGRLLYTNEPGVAGLASGALTLFESGFESSKLQRSEAEIWKEMKVWE